jgi:hypothetical protein
VNEPYIASSRLPLTAVNPSDRSIDGGDVDLSAQLPLTGRSHDGEDADVLVDRVARRLVKWHRHKRRRRLIRRLTFFFGVVGVVLSIGWVGRSYASSAQQWQWQTMTPSEIVWSVWQ